MARKRKGDLINGWLVLNKPVGLSSSQALGRAKHLLNAQKAGHGGTLDPMASGVLPIAFGEATKTTAYAMDLRKAYTFSVRWGEATETDDAEGEVIETSDLRPSTEAINAALEGFIGEIEQIPPTYSAKKVNGRRAYELARQDKAVVLEPRTVVVETFELVDVPDPDHARFHVVCGKGTYVRALARDMARDLGTVGHVSELVRTRVGPFRIEDAISLDKLEALVHSAPASELLLPVEAALDDILALVIPEADARRLKSGQSVPVLRAARHNPQARFSQGATVCAMSEGKLVALAKITGGEIQPVRVINL